MSCILYYLSVKIKKKKIGFKLFNLFEIYLKLFILFNYVFDKILNFWLAATINSLQKFTLKGIYMYVGGD